RSLSFCKLRVGIEGMRGRVTRRWPYFQWRSVSIDGTRCVSVRQAGPGKCVLRVEFCGTGKKFAGAPGGVGRELVPEIPTAQVQIVSLGITGLPAGDGGEAFRRKLQSDSLSNGCADLALKFQDAAGFAVKERGPQLHLVSHANKPRRDANPATLAAD